MQKFRCRFRSLLNKPEARVVRTENVRFIVWRHRKFQSRPALAIRGRDSKISCAFSVGGMAYSLFPVNHSTTNQSGTPMSSGMWKSVDSTFLRVCSSARTIQRMSYYYRNDNLIEHTHSYKATVTFRPIIFKNSTQLWNYYYNLKPE